MSISKIKKEGINVIGKWKETDHAKHQLCRDLGNGLYEFYQLTSTGKLPGMPESFWISHGVINSRNLYIEDISEGDETSYRIAAKLDFEMNAMEYVICREFLDQQEGAELIDAMVTGDKIRIETPKGAMFAKTKGVPDEYPGIWIVMERPDDPDPEPLAAMVEYDNCNDRINVVSYCKDKDKVQKLIDWETGEQII